MHISWLHTHKVATLLNLCTMVQNTILHIMGYGMLLPISPHKPQKYPVGETAVIYEMIRNVLLEYEILAHLYSNIEEQRV